MASLLVVLTLLLLLLLTKLIKKDQKGGISLKILHLAYWLRQDVKRFAVYAKPKYMELSLRQQIQEQSLII